MVSENSRPLFWATLGNRSLLRKQCSGVVEGRLGSEPQSLIRDLRFPSPTRLVRILPIITCQRLQLTFDRRLLVCHDDCVCLPDPRAYAGQVQVRKQPGRTASSETSSGLHTRGTPARLSCNRPEEQTGHVAIWSPGVYQWLQDCAQEHGRLHQLVTWASCG